MLKVDAQAYSVEAANPRHEHEWKLWQDVKLPEGKILIPGVVSHATNVVEHPELVADRIKQYANCVGSENVIAGTDCGMGGRIRIRRSAGPSSRPWWKAPRWRRRSSGAASRYS